MKQELSYIPDLTVAAGQCSSDDSTPLQIEQIANIRVADAKGISRRGVYMARNVGEKSRTNLDDDEDKMGIDTRDVNTILALEGVRQAQAIADITLPSAHLAHEIVYTYGLGVAMEVMIPHIQLPSWEREVPDGKALIWNPSVNQLGWQILETTQFANRKNWQIGIKNGKALGATLADANTLNHKETSLEKGWAGLASYARGAEGRVVLIHRGVDVPEKGNNRNALVHEVARRVKHRTGAVLFFDPSHSYGPKLRDTIVQKTIETMHMKDGNEWLYDGILIEAGTSKTDTDQHITIDELEGMLQELATFRNLKEPDPVLLRNNGVVFTCS